MGEILFENVLFGRQRAIPGRRQANPNIRESVKTLLDFCVGRMPASRSFVIASSGRIPSLRTTPTTEIPWRMCIVLHTPIIDTGEPGARCGEKEKKECNGDRGCATIESYSAVP